MNLKSNKESAECVGLWLAEGDNKCHNEITFTNNEFGLIQFFHKNILNLFSKYDFRTRLYIYSPNKQIVKTNLKVDKINNYIDKRANKPYYIWRLASVNLNKQWKEIVGEYKTNPHFYSDILRGFFAGEGNIKAGSHNNRTIRIAQKKYLFLEKILSYFDIEFTYRIRERAYCITGKPNWDKLAEIKIANLHQLKKQKFWEVYNSFKEEHYKTGFLKSAVSKTLINPITTRNLSQKFSRSLARIQEILIGLKKQGNAFNFRIGNVDYWTKNPNDLLISKLKKSYLSLLNSPKSTTELAKKFKVCFKSSYNRLKELEKLGLTERLENKKWIKKQTKKKILVIQ